MNLNRGLRLAMVAIPVFSVSGASHARAANLKTARASDEVAMAMPGANQGSSSQAAVAAPSFQTNGDRTDRGPTNSSAKSPGEQSPSANIPVHTQAASLPTTTRFRPITLEEHADIYLARKQYLAAIDSYTQALRQHSSDPYVWNKLGIAYQLDMNFAAARKAYKTAAREKPDFSEPWNNTGTTYFLQNKFGKSVKYYKNAIKLHPEIASFHLNLSASYSRMKKFDQAVAECREALRLDPQVLIRHSGAATAVQARGTDVEFYYYLAKVFASMSRPDDAVHYLRRALEDGFKDMKRIDRDPDFQKISNYPAFVQLRKNPPVPIED